ncbi:PLP-dependent aminotransferase family protein [Tateyamaria sp. SN3-11]|uniref:MocR-like pyridoxine biosynthesis transcription factor PdxR n=1 Tax=Tateyamaria sp. SN3-11 TaxID=3092147 RepID=UPI0039E97FD6
MALPVETFFLSPTHQGTLQSQVQQMIAHGILSGRFGTGEKLPSTRKLATHLGISRITVTLAYTELVASDYLTARGRSGYYVSSNAPVPPVFQPQHAASDSVDWTRAIGQRFAGGETLTKPQDWARFRYPFIYGQTDPQLFDHANWRQCALQALGQRDFSALTSDYFDRDDPQLIEFIQRNTLPRRGIAANADQILITLGAQNALWLAAQVLLTQRRTAAFEDPCYPALREILTQSRCHMAPVRVDRDGLPPDAIPPEADVIFTTPSHQCPTTATMPMARRQALLDRARDLDALVVEDDYEFEMSFLEPPSPALKSMDTDGRVIYVGSFSKSLFPGLRLGYLVGSEPFVREARALRTSVLRHPPGHIQRTAAYFLSMGHYDAQIRKMGAALHTRRSIMQEAIDAHGLDIAGIGAFGGSSFWMRAPDGHDARHLAAQLQDKSVLIEPGHTFFSGEDQPRTYYRLGYSSIQADRISDGIELIANCLDG